LLLKYNSSGDLEWYTTWGGIWEGKGSGIAIDTLGNVFITGYTDSYGAGDDVLVLKYDSDGNLLWYKTWGGSEDDTGEGIVVDSSGSVFIIGTTYSYGVGSHDVFLLKYDSSGNLLWDKTWGGSDSDFGNGIAVDNSGNAFITGHTYSYGTGRGDIFLSKYDSDGNLLWYKTWEGFFYNNGQGIAVDSIGNAYITGYFTSRENLSNHDIFIIKYGVDTDNDGLSDNDEIFIYFTNPNNPDTDFDGLSDGKEIELGTNPLDADTDNDRFTDREEVNSGTDPLNFFDNWLSRGILITFSIAIIMIGYKRYKEKHGKKVNVISEKGEAFKKPNNLKESIKSYQETVLKMKKTNKSIPKSTQNVFMELQIKDLIEKADNLKREGEIIKALETINYAGYIVDKITESSLKQLLTKNIINNLDQIYIEMVEKKIEEALNLREMKDFDESINMFNNALSDADKIRDTTLMDKNFSILKDYINTTRMIKTKDFIFNLSQNSERLEVSEIVEKCGMGEGFILSAILDMIKNREISAEYIKSTKEVVFNRQVDVEQIDRLMKSFEDWEKEGEGKKL
ncbi:MAG: SBBP repeat-containing protein, partial [Promethearchaeota archaeon]